MVKKYGIKYVPTGEWVVCSTGGKDYLFTEDKTKIRMALADILYSDGGYDGEEKDFEIQSIKLPEDYDGSRLVEGENVFFIDPQIVDSHLAMLDAFKQYGIE